jgi:sialate O-acetylesterase
MTGPANVMKLACPSRPGDAPIALAGTWRYAVEANYGKVPILGAPMGPGNPNAPRALFNGMISPLIPLALRGAIWYQGESNADRPRQYRTLLQTMIRDWRKRFGHDLHFHIVQLANYMACPDQPVESKWAELREAQGMALGLPNTGMVVIIDIGEGGDIHPRNKQDVGLRLAMSVLNKTYAQREVCPSGPMFREAKREGHTLRVSFDHAEGLATRPAGAALTGFAIRGADGRFVWAEARIDGKTVVVSSRGVAEPVAVRYAWADNPACNLYNGAGLPASPFRSDRD